MKDDFYHGIAFYALLWAVLGPLFGDWTMYAWGFNLLVFLFAILLRFRPEAPKSRDPNGHPFLKSIDQGVCMVPWCECGRAKAVRIDEGWEIRGCNAGKK